MASTESIMDETGKTVEILLKHNTDVNIQNQDGMTALIFVSQYASINENVSTVNMLLKHKVNINIKDNRGRSALM